VARVRHAAADARSAASAASGWATGPVVKQRFDLRTDPLTCLNTTVSPPNPHRARTALPGSTPAPRPASAVGTLLRVALMAFCLSPWAVVRATDAVAPARTCTAIPRPPASPGMSHTLAVSLNVFAGTAWSSEKVGAAILEAAGLLEQCAIHVARIDLCTIEAPHRFRFYSTPASRDLLRQIEIPKPAVFFVEDTLNEPAFDAEAIGRGNAGSRPELADTIWVAFGARDLPQALAHELVHVLSDSGRHSDQPGNLMLSVTSPGATRLSADQCEHMRTRATANRLLEAVRP
jgi:hypothetical protein